MEKKLSNLSKIYKLNLIYFKIQLYQRVAVKYYRRNSSYYFVKSIQKVNFFLKPKFFLTILRTATVKL